MSCVCSLFVCFTCSVYTGPPRVCRYQGRGSGHFQSRLQAFTRRFTRVSDPHTVCSRQEHEELQTRVGQPGTCVCVCVCLCLHHYLACCLCLLLDFLCLLLVQLRVPVCCVPDSVVCQAFVCQACVCVCVCVCVCAVCQIV